MIDLNIGGACPRRPLALALMEGLGVPVVPGPLGETITVAAVDYPSIAAIKMIADAAIASGQDALLALFAHPASTVCQALVLIHRSGTGADILQVEPCRVKPSQPIILVTVDRTRAFVLDEREVVTVRPVPSKAKTDRGISRAWKETVASMRQSEADPTDWDSAQFGIVTPFRARMAA